MASFYALICLVLFSPDSFSPAPALMIGARSPQPQDDGRLPVDRISEENFCKEHLDCLELCGNRYLSLHESDISKYSTLCSQTGFNLMAAEAEHAARACCTSARYDPVVYRDSFADCCAQRGCEVSLSLQTDGPGICNLCFLHNDLSPTKRRGVLYCRNKIVSHECTISMFLPRTEP